MNVKKIVFPDDFNNLQKEIDSLKAKMKVASKQITKELSEYGLKEMKDIYDNFGYLSFGNEPNSFYIEDSKDGGKNIVMEGPQAIYEEFGTGTEGEINPYPINPKDYGLDGYNSHLLSEGKGTIRPARGVDTDEARKQGTHIPEGGLFWTYRNTVGDKIYTQGTPAQKEGYDSMNKTYDKSKEVIKKVMKEVVFND